MPAVDEAAERAHPVTMRDVASRAGVGLATVSRVVNGKGGVTTATVDRVRAAVNELGYRPDFTASSLRRADRKTDLVGMVLENLANPFSSALHRAVEDAAAERGLLLLSGSNDEDPERERQLVRSFIGRRVDGLIVAPTGRANDELAAARQRGTALVCVDRPVELSGVDSVTVDNRDSMRAAVLRLRRAGHRRIGYLGDLSTIWTAAQRYAGFVAGLAEAGLPFDERLARRDIHGEAHAARAAWELCTLAEPPTAVLSAQNLLTIGACHALWDLGVERRVALIGFDDFPMANLLRPGVSVIAQDVRGLGRTAADLLFARLDGDRTPAREVVVPTRYVARGSGELPGPAE